LEPGGLDAGFESRAVGLGVLELQRVGRDEVLVVLDPLLIIEQQAQALGCVHAEMMPALGADVDVSGEILVVNRLCAACALDPQTLRYAARLALRDRDRFPGLLEPGHEGSAYHQGFYRVRGT